MILPNTSAAMFTARRIVHAKEIWRDSECATDSPLENYAYCVPRSIDPPDMYASDSRECAADRYGGVGVGYCGGSARCGTLENIQIKGIGLTPLFAQAEGQPPDIWHSTGTITMQDAIREAIWSSICSSALPFGAVRSEGIVLTGSATFASLLDKEETPRALLLREPSIRPAHFLRNVFFPRAVIAERQLISDAERTVAAICSMPDMLVRLLRLARTSSLTEIVNESLVEIVRRFAAQIGAAFSKRIFHRALTCSNISLDGKYVDFGVMTAVSSYRRLAGAPSPGGPDQWNQHLNLLQTVTGLRAHVARYLKDVRVSELIETKALLGLFGHEINRCMENEFLKLLGFSEVEVSGAPRAVKHKAFQCMREIYSRGATERFASRNPTDPEAAFLTPIVQVGRYDLNRLITKSSSADTDEVFANIVDAEVDDRALAARFCDVYKELRCYHRSIVDLSRWAEVDQSRRLAAERRNADISFLEHGAVDFAVSQLKSEMVASYIKSTVTSALAIMKY